APGRNGVIGVVDLALDRLLRGRREVEHVRAHEGTRVLVETVRRVAGRRRFAPVEDARVVLAPRVVEARVVRASAAGVRPGIRAAAVWARAREASVDVDELASVAVDEVGLGAATCDEEHEDGGESSAHRTASYSTRRARCRGARRVDQKRPAHTTPPAAGAQRRAELLGTSPGASIASTTPAVVSAAPVTKSAIAAPAPASRSARSASSLRQIADAQRPSVASRSTQ